MSSLSTFIKQNEKRIFIALSIAIIFGAIFIRFWQLNDIPPGIQYDEAFNGLNAIRALESGNYQVFYTENFGREGFHINVTAIFVKIFGATNAAIRYASAMWGSLTIIGFFFLLRQLKFSRATILVGTFMLATSFWHLDFSRTAYRAIMVPMLIIWIFYFFLRGIEEKKHKTRHFIISAALLGLGFHTYIAYRVFPLALIILVAAFVYVQNGFIKKYWKNAVMYLGVSLIVALPMFVYFWNHHNDLIGRSETVSIFDDPATRWQDNFKKSFQAHMKAFFIRGDGNPRHNYDFQPILPRAWQVVFLGGFVLSLSEIGRTIYRKRKLKKSDRLQEFQPTRFFYVSVMAQATSWLLLIPGVMSIEAAPHTLRIIGMIPGVFLICAMFLEWLKDVPEKVKNFKKSKPCWSRKKTYQILYYGIIFSVLVAGTTQVYTYFVIWPKDGRTLGGFERRLFELGLLTKELPVKKDNYLITANNTAISKNNRDSSFKTTQYIGWPNIDYYYFFPPMLGFKNINCEDPQIVFLDADQWLIDRYQGLCEGLTARRESIPGGYYTYWVVTRR